ncbi:zona pellucida sperm-binding protein 3 [Kryptolebias marmoratus]|uniref:Zona pellucida sperm-binding protein 3 n=1 Tax=Kryptolebias marmoratus TaxID=37003 RepID=A0A3Q3BBJ5_KRYMA|nr:zona pellucida sperm-binding protein 3 [Kryptolebias marmoratus]
MGFGAAVLLGFLLLQSGGNFGSAAQNFLVFGANETLRQTKQEAVTVSSQQANQTEQRRHPPATYRLKVYQLQTPSALSEKQRRPLGEEQPSPVAAAAAAFEPASGLNPSTSEPAKMESKVEAPAPLPAQSVSVRCGEDRVLIAVKQDFLGNGQLIRPSDLTLGGCAVLDTVDHIMLFQAELHGCGATLTMTEVSLVYKFALMYSPTPIASTSILKTNPVEVTVRCHFPRRHYVSSDAMRPAWTTFASERQAEQRLRFSMRLLTDDWLSPRPSNVYFLTDVVHLEASVLRGAHVPLRVFVDRCVATANPDPASQLRYPFVSNHGCLTDSKLTGAKSYFLPRSQEDKLHLQLKAFKFQQDDKNSVYVTCHLKATVLDDPIDTRHKACSYLTEAKRWVASGGDNNVCSCCDTSCGGQRQRRRPAADSAPRGEGTAALGPNLIEELPEPKPRLQTREETQDALSL